MTPIRVAHVITRLIVGGAQENTVATVLGAPTVPKTTERFNEVGCRPSLPRLPRVELIRRPPTGLVLTTIANITSNGEHFERRIAMLWVGLAHVCYHKHDAVHEAWRE